MPPCSTCPPYPERIRPGCHEGVTVFTQYASADLIGPIAYEGLNPANDPAWGLSGATSREDYGRWCRHLCGLACFQTALHHYFGTTPTLFSLLAGCREYGGYVEIDGDIHGLIYEPFARYAREVYGLYAKVFPVLETASLMDLLTEEYLVIASVGKEIRRPEIRPTKRGGHLVLVTGHAADSDTVLFSNPSGHTAEARMAELSKSNFEEFFGNRGVALHRF